MHLKQPFWKTGSNSNFQARPESAVTELVNSLDQQRLYREVTLALLTGLREARAEFSFLRVRGLQSLLKFLRSVAESDATINLFCNTQSLPDLQVVPVLFQQSLQSLRDSLDDESIVPDLKHIFGVEPKKVNSPATDEEVALALRVPVLFQQSLRDSLDDESIVPDLKHIFGVEPKKVNSPATDEEVALALRVLEGCCLLHQESTLLANQHNAIPVLMNILSTRGVLEQSACLDALISILLDTSANQMDFERCNGIEEVALLIQDKQTDENLRLKCGEFLLLLNGHVNGRDMATVHADVRRFLGEKCASLIWAASQFGSTLDPQERLTALHIQARRVLESIDLYH